MEDSLQEKLSRAVKCFDVPLKGIISETKNDAVWKRLRYFQDREYAVQKICEAQHITEDTAGKERI
jgi:hypothetical protein